MRFYLAVEVREGVGKFWTQRVISSYTELTLPERNGVATRRSVCHG
jgi:hypothetical protein